MDKINENLVKNAKANGITKEEYNDKFKLFNITDMHKLYGKNEGGHSKSIYCKCKLCEAKEKDI
jgi:hypothetical protein